MMGRIPIGDTGWFIPVTVGYQHLASNKSTVRRFPNAWIFANEHGVGYHFDQKLSVSASAGPLFYNLEEARGDNMGIGGLILASYVLNEQFRFMAGIAANPDSRFPVFPMSGVIWRIRDDLTLEAVAPRTTLIYRFAPKTTVYAATGFQFATFRTSENLAEQTGVAGFNNAIATYEDVPGRGRTRIRNLQALFFGSRRRVLCISANRFYTHP